MRDSPGRKNKKHRGGKKGVSPGAEARMDLVAVRLEQEKRKRLDVLFVPTEEQRNMVKICVAMGATYERISYGVINPHTGWPISVPTLEKAFALELKTGQSDMDSICSGMLAKKVREGNMTAIIWYMKNRMGWRDSWDISGLPANNHVVINIAEKDLAKQLQERGLPASIFGVTVPTLDDAYAPIETNGVGPNGKEPQAATKETLDH